MTVRDWIKGKDHFDAYIAAEEQRAEHFDKRQREVDDEAWRAELQSYVVWRLCSLTLASYSRGDPMEEVARRAQMAFDYALSHSIKANCDIRLASFVTLLIEDPAERSALRRGLHDEDNPNWTTDFLLGCDPAEIDWEDPGEYTAVHAIWDAPEEERQAVLVRKVSRWYSSMKVRRNWGVPDRTGNYYSSYYGYWAVELAATARRLHIDDSALKGKNYYPYELAHWLDG